MPKYSPDVNLHYYRRLAQTMVVSIVSRNKPASDPKRDRRSNGGCPGSRAGSRCAGGSLLRANLVASFHDEIRSHS